MALSILDTSYSGTVEAGFMVTQATFSASTLKKQVAFVKDGIKKQHVIPTLAMNSGLTRRVVTPVTANSGSTTVDKIILDPQKTMVYQEFLPADFEDHFYAEQLSQTLLARELPLTFENVMMQLQLNYAFQDVERGIHMGSKGYTTSAATRADANHGIKDWDGIIRQLLIAGTFIPVPSPSAITAGNIMAKFQSAYSLLSKGILDDVNRYDKVKFLVSIEDSLLYEEATTVLTNKGNDISKAGTPMYKGYNVVSLAGLPKDTFYVCRAYPDLESNIWVGTNAFEDQSFELKRLQNNSELFYLKGLMAFDVKVAKPNEFVMHTTQVAGNFIV